MIFLEVAKTLNLSICYINPLRIGGRICVSYDTAWSGYL